MVSLTTAFTLSVSRPQLSHPDHYVVNPVVVNGEKFLCEVLVVQMRSVKGFERYKDDILHLQGAKNFFIDNHQCMQIFRAFKILVGTVNDSVKCT